MSSFQTFINEDRVAQHRHDRMEQAAAERSIGAMRMERQMERQRGNRQEEEATQSGPAPSSPSSFMLRQAWGALACLLASFF